MNIVAALPAVLLGLELLGKGLMWLRKYKEEHPEEATNLVETGKSLYNWYKGWKKENPDQARKLEDAVKAAAKDLMKGK